MRRSIVAVVPVVLTAIVVIGASASTAIVIAPATSDNASPQAEAGLDQRVANGTTVVLDGNGSLDPDGRIVAYEWSIRTPDASVIGPADHEAVRTTFVVDQTGLYVVSLTVTDDDGATATDVMLVRVVPGSGSGSTSGGDGGAEPDDGNGSTSDPENDTDPPPDTDPDPDPDNRTDTNPGNETDEPAENGSDGPGAPNGSAPTNDTSPNGTAPWVTIDGPGTLAPGESAVYRVVAGDPESGVDVESWGGPGTGTTVRRRAPADADAIELSVTVADAAGRATTVTRPVRVVPDGGPTIELLPPGDVAVGDTVRFDTEVSAPNRTVLDVIVIPNRTVSFDRSGRYLIRAVVVTTDGLTASDRLMISPERADENGTTGRSKATATPPSLRSSGIGVRGDSPVQPTLLTHS